MMAHTPGPWKWFNYPDGRMLLSGVHEAVIHCPDAPMSVTDEDQRLIVAAPDLLEALKPLTAWLTGSSVNGDTVASMRGMLFAARAAIAKAEGR